MWKPPAVGAAFAHLDQPRREIDAGDVRTRARAASSATFPAPQPTSRNSSPGLRRERIDERRRGRRRSTRAISSNAPADQATAARCLNSVKSGIAPGGYKLASTCASASRAASCSASFFVRPSPRPSSSPSTTAAHVKRRSCAGPSADELRVRHAPARSREELLEVGLRVDAGRDRDLDVLGERVDDRAFDRREAVREEERAERRLEDRADDARRRAEPLRVVLQPGGRARDEPLAEPERLADDSARRARDDVRPRLRQPALRIVGMPRVERRRDRELEHAVAEELEALVRRRRGSSVHEACVKTTSASAGGRPSISCARRSRYWWLVT